MSNIEENKLETVRQTDPGMQELRMVRNRLMKKEKFEQSNFQVQECENNIKELEAKLRVERARLEKQLESNRVIRREINIAKWAEEQKNTHSVTDLAGILARIVGWRSKVGTKYVTIERENRPELRVEISTGDIYFGSSSKKVGGNIRSIPLESVRKNCGVPTPGKRGVFSMDDD